MKCVILLCSELSDDYWYFHTFVYAEEPPVIDCVAVQKYGT
jgi:hypothetical protein